jgi:nicotinamidase/pyrazinamidase
VSTSERRPLLWDVDTQVDFMEPDGRLYVPGADATRHAIGRLVHAARAAGIVHVASADDHLATDAEISDEPDFARTYPPHCMRGTRGAARIPESEQADPLVLQPDALAPLAELAPGRREFLLLKQSTDVFTNPNAELVLDILRPSEVIVFGVATDVCDHAAIVGMRHRGWSVAFVEDAASGLSDERVAACTAEWRALGVRFTTSDAVVAELLGRAERR